MVYTYYGHANADNGLDDVCRIYGMMSQGSSDGSSPSERSSDGGSPSSTRASRRQKNRKQQQSTPVIDPEILGDDSENDPWKQ